MNAANPEILFADLRNQNAVKSIEFAFFANNVEHLVFCGLNEQSQRNSAIVFEQGKTGRSG